MAKSPKPPIACTHDLIEVLSTNGRTLEGAARKCAQCGVPIYDEPRTFKTSELKPRVFIPAPTEEQRARREIGPITVAMSLFGAVHTPRERKFMNVAIDITGLSSGDKDMVRDALEEALRGAIESIPYTIEVDE